MKIDNVFYLPSGRIFLLDCDGYKIECTEMRDVSINGKEHLLVREATDPREIWKHLVPWRDKWLLTVSTQKGCIHNCQFCDVAPLPFKGNLTSSEIIKQVELLLDNTPWIKECNKVKIGFARMGEPAHNLQNILEAMELLPIISNYTRNKKFNWLPCFNTILPEKCVYKPEEVLGHVLDIKEKKFKGFFHLQISCNSTSEEKRQELFGNSSVMSIEKIITYINKQKITNRTVTLNFIVMQGVEISVEKLIKMGVNRDKFIIKLIPLNHTKQGDSHNLETYANYSNYEKLQQLKDKFTSAGIPTVMDAIAKCEEAGLCCGQLAQIYQ